MTIKNDGEHEEGLFGDESIFLFAAVQIITSF